MKKAALYVKGKIVVGFNHGDAFSKLSEEEQHQEILSGFFDDETEEFLGDDDAQHFYDKSIFLIRHALVDDKENPDPDISYEGERQVKSLASSMRSNNLNDYEFICSPFLRCLKTAAILQESLGLKISVEPRLAETPMFLEDGEQFFLKNHSQTFSSFQWQTEKDFVLESETKQSFRQRTLIVLKSLPHRCVLITHFGVISNITKLALCEQKAINVLKEGLPPASVTHIHQQEVGRWENYANKYYNRSETENS